MDIDIYLFNKINGLAGKSICLDSTAIFFARYFEYVLIIVLLLFLVKEFKKYWPMVVQAFSAAILSRFVITNIIRWLLPRPRPFVALHLNSLFYQNPAEPSFPSGHAAFYFAIATVVYLYNKRVGISFLIAAFLISIARVFSGIHWPSDILAGAAIGIFSGWLINIIYSKFFKK
jgi:undecaprenyl-diphosphatase